MSRSMRGALTAAVLALAFWSLAQIAYSLFFCRPHRAFEAAAGGTAPIVLDRGERVARSGDSIYTCTTIHHLGPIALHQDLDCYCASQSLSLQDVAQAVSGTCQVDHLAPTRLDDTGSCRFARCNHYVDQ